MVCTSCERNKAPAATAANCGQEYPLVVCTTALFRGGGAAGAIVFKYLHLAVENALTNEDGSWFSPSSDTYDSPLR